MTYVLPPCEQPNMLVPRYLASVHLCIYISIQLSAYNRKTIFASGLTEQYQCNIHKGRIATQKIKDHHNIEFGCPNVINLISQGEEGVECLECNMLKFYTLYL